MSETQDFYGFETRNFRQTLGIPQSFDDELYSVPAFGGFEANNNQEVIYFDLPVNQASPRGSYVFSPRPHDTTWSPGIPQSYEQDLYQYGNQIDPATRNDTHNFSVSSICSSGTTQGTHDYEEPFYTQGSGDDSNESVEFDPMTQNSSNYFTFNNGAPQALVLPHFDTFLGQHKIKQKRGRPPTFHKPGYHYSDSDSPHSDEDSRVSISAVSKCRRGAKNILLWKFLLEELRKPQNHIKWENEYEGTFKFVDTAECSRLWGQMKKKEDMNFEKLSRGIRHYYKDELMSRKDGVRLVYKFNWNRVPKEFCPPYRR